MSKRQLRQFLTKRIKRTLRPEEIKADETALKLFGLVPPDFDLKKSTIDLLTEQAAAFYDYDEKKLFLLEESSLSAEVTTLAHELAHALADQHFDLEKFMDDSAANDDENLARTAVVEGQASWLMIAYDLRLQGLAPVPTPEMLKALADSGEGSSSDYPVLKGSPLYIKRSLLFPYAEGTVFFDAVYKKEGKKAFTEVFRDPPQDSAQIIHPERYFSAQRETSPPLPDIGDKNADTALSEGTVGEFDHTILLWQYVNEQRARALAPHARGGRFKVVTPGRDDGPMLIYASEWDSSDTAREFFEAYQKVLRSKWRLCDVTLARGGIVAGEGDNGYFVLKLDGAVVSSVEGISDLNTWNRLTGARISWRRAGLHPAPNFSSAINSR
jgi:Zn-dependent peptidase ImmA (M78 family)